MRLTPLCLLLSFAFTSIMQVARAGNDMQILTDAPELLASTYKAERMVRTVNYLRSLRKEGALTALRNYINQSDTTQQAKVLIICRLLFVNPQGWKPPKLGEPLPAINESIAEQFPYFPIALSGGVPFLIVKAYRIGGRAESADACIKLCEGFSIITADLPEANSPVASQELIQSRLFRQLYKNTDDEKAMVEIVMRQAGTDASTR